MNNQAKSINLHTIERNRRWSKWTLGLLLGAGCLASHTSHAQSSPLPVNPAALTAIKISPQTTIAQLRSQPQVKVTLASGRVVSASSITTLTDALKGMQVKAGSLQRMDLKFSKPTGATQLRLHPSNLAAARLMPATTVLELPNGLKLTSGELKKLDAFEARLKPNVRQLLGGQLSTGIANSSRFAGQAPIVVKTKADIAQLKGKPDSTVVQGPDGSLATLGDLKQEVNKRFGPVRR
jgi:hypothetical protein